jgi:signal transduction histidine kinase
LAAWAGGVALYRDGYRVNPYGGPNDDWLDLDRDAFSTSGFKLNRGQIIGRARITQKANPYLVDQTNREGLKDSPEKGAFVALLSAAVEQYRLYIVEIDEDERRARRLTAAAALERFSEESDRLSEIIPRLQKILEATAAGRAISKEIVNILEQLKDMATQLEAASSAHEQERARIIHLASIGLMIEVLTHELYRATANGLKTIGQARGTRDAATLSTSLRVLEAQLRTLQKRLQVLDPLSTNARQNKEEFDVVEWVTDIVNGFAARNQDSRISVRCSVSPRSGSWAFRGVKGMFVQILENLLSNSLYWIAQQHRYEVRAGRAGDDDANIGSIDVAIRPTAKQIRVTDSGPGIPEERREVVFEPFFSTKRNKEGRGLGLYIAREIAEYHGGRLTLGEANDDGNINAVVLEVGASDDE